MKRSRPSGSPRISADDDWKLDQHAEGVVGAAAALVAAARSVSARVLPLMYPPAQTTRGLAEDTIDPRGFRCQHQHRHASCVSKSTASGVVRAAVRFCSRRLLSPLQRLSRPRASPRAPRADRPPQRPAPPRRGDAPRGGRSKHRARLGAPPGPRGSGRPPRPRRATTLRARAPQPHAGVSHAAPPQAPPAGAAAPHCCRGCPRVDEAGAAAEVEAVAAEQRANARARQAAEVAVVVAAAGRQ
jgi:hypothetical protein